MSKKLSPLRAIEPTTETLSSIKATIDARIALTHPHKKHTVSYKHGDLLSSPYMRRTLYALSFFMFLFAFHLENPYVLTRGITASRVAFAPHAHARSQIVLSDLENITKDEFLFANTHDYTAVRKTIDLNKSTLDTLALQGEQSVYSMDDCLSDYTKYFHLLTALDKKLTRLQNNKNVDRTAISSLREQVHEALEEAEERLGSYPEDME
jgi:hypothetical protein